MRKIASLCLALIAPLASAEDTPTMFAGNLTLASNYIFRGISQSFNQPAVQGELDFNHPTGFYASLWSSNISGSWYAGGSQEIDVSLGYQAKINDDMAYNVGIISINYPNANANRETPPLPDQKFDSAEVYGSISWKFITFKYNRMITNYVGDTSVTAPVGSFNGAPQAGVNPGAGTKGSGYFDLSAAFDPGEGWGVNAHVGHQIVTNSTGLSYTDFRFGVTKDFSGGWSGALTFTSTSGTNAYKNYLSLTGNGQTENLSRATLVGSVVRAF